MSPGRRRIAPGAGVMPDRLGRVAVVGAGAVGAYYGAKLARAGEDVTFLFRRDLQTVRERGLTIRADGLGFHLHPLAAFGTTAEIGAVDLVLVALKATSNAALDSLLPPLLHPGTGIATLQNGLGSDEYLARRFGAERVLGGLCFVCLNRVGAGVVECYHPGTVTVGEFERPAGERAHALSVAFRRAGVACTVTDNLAETRWRKLVWNVPFNGLSIANGGVTTDAILAEAALLAEARTLMREVQRAAAAFGHRIADDYLERQIELTAPMGPYKPSSLVDFLAGQAVEVEAIWGEPMRRAVAAGVEVPRLSALYRRLCELCVTDIGRGHA